jgi:hypothetical protein
MRNKTKRYFKVYEDGYNNPYIMIKAKWLNACGFIPHAQYELKVKNNKLILEIIKEQEI